ncbi:MAG: transcription antitermination factor NusB [Eubacteriales bacterium]|nr:transcription antitermination factor NusB [Eubacteriales bacterium]NCC81319.1 transcription antitermination factor NusB [Clostridia bacterium]
MVKREARERALVALYQMDVVNAEPKEALMDRYEYDEVKPIPLSIELIQGVKENLEFVDEIISKYSKEWDISRFSNIDRNILRIAIYEIHFMEKIPYKVSINEAVELAKTFSTEEAYKFINGILAQVVKELEN